MRRIALTALVLATSFVMTSPTWAAEEEEHVVAFRLPKAKTMHFDDAAKAKSHAETLKKFGCDVKLDNHGGHTDVKYELKGWSSQTFTSDELADQWETWLTNSGFDAIHGHEHEAHGEAVEYHSDKWLVQHFERAPQAAEFLTVAKALGCETRQDSHDGHYDVQFRLTSWRHLEAPNDDIAHARQDWLKKLGFETKHSH